MVARAEIDPLDLLDAGGRSARSAAVQRSSVPFVRQIGVEALRHLRPDLVAARPDRRARSRPPSGRRRALRRPPRRPPRRARASRRAEPRVARCAVGARDGDRQAVGRHREQRHRGLVGPEPVARLAARARVRAVHRRRVHLAVEREPLVRSGREPRTRAGGSPRRARGRRRCRASGSAIVRRLADAADARRERDDVPRLSQRIIA